MASKNFQPHTIYEDQRLITRAQPSSSDDKSPFSNGAFPDMDPSMIPQRAVNVLNNYRCYPWGLLARPGCRRWSNTTLPSLTGRTGYSWSKAGTTITRTVGANFSEDDVGNYVVHDDGDHERIEQYLTANTVRVSTSTAHAASTAGYVRGPKNAMLYHKKRNLLVLLIDTRVFYSDILMTSWIQIVNAHINGAPVSDISRMRAYDDFVVLFNAGGMYKIDLVNYVYWQMNSACPSTRITDIPKSTTVSDYTLKTDFVRNVVYTMGRLSGTYSQTRDRFTSGVEIVQETGAVAADSSGKDFGEIHTPYRFGDGSTTFGRLICEALGSPYDVPSGWSGISDGHFTIAMNGTTYEVTCDFTGVISMSEVAERIQAALRDHVTTAECEYRETHFNITVPDEGGTIGYMGAGTSGTDISEALEGTEALCYDLTNLPFTYPTIVGNLEIPTDPITGTYDSHFDIYSVYSTLDVGPLGSDPVTGKGNNDQEFIWQADVPVAKAFVASRTASTITATEGTFQPCDKGCKFRFQDGTEVVLDDYVSAAEFTTEDSGSVSSQAAAIGGDNALGKAIRVMTASQTGTTVTRTAGDTFSSNDIGRTIFWPDGTQSLITAYTDANTVTVLTSATIASTGCCIEPKTRKYADCIRDDVSGTLANMRTRIGNPSYILQTRIFDPMPDCNMGEVTANMLWGIEIGGNIVHYCAADVNFRHQAGYHYASKQREIFQDAIYEISEVSNTLSVKCGHSTRAIPLNQFGSYQISAAGIAIILAKGQDMVDERIGVKDFGGVLPIDRSKQVVITAEPAIRVFDGTAFGENIAADRIQKIIEVCQAAYCMSYDPVNGLTIWLLEE